jgi:hypothetical protein
MKKFLKTIPIILIVVLAISLYSKASAFWIESNHVSFNAGEIANLTGHSYQIYLFPLTLCETDHFTSASIKFSESNNTFSLILSRKDGSNEVTYLDCSYEEVGFWFTLFEGYGNGSNDGSGFTITGINVVNQYIAGIFEFRLITFPPVECSYLFWGIVINGT